MDINTLILLWLIGVIVLGLYSSTMGIINKEGYLVSLDKILIPILSSLWFTYLLTIIVKSLFDFYLNFYLKFINN